MTIFDLGGATGQITDKSGLIYTNYLGKETVKGDIGVDKLYPCFNDNFQYQGSKCRDEIHSYIASNFGDSLPQIKIDDTSLFGVSSFHNFLNDLCNAYAPFIEREQLELNVETLDLVDYLCQLKRSHNNPIVIKVVDYKDIADEICNYETVAR